MGKAKCLPLTQKGIIMNIVNVTTKGELDILYGLSALTLEGLISDEENLNAFNDWLNSKGAIYEGLEPVFHCISGELMNKTYGLTGTNAYPDDLTIVAVTDIMQARVAMPRYEIGARWFDDIVDNNARREKEKR